MRASRPLSKRPATVERTAMVWATSAIAAFMRGLSGSAQA